MLKRLVVSVVEGALIGGLVAALLLVLGFEWTNAAVVYGAAALTGVTTGLVAGKPLWAKAAKLEAVLKAGVGTFLSVMSMYGLRKWLPSVSLDLGARFGSGSIGELPAASLPLIAVAIAFVFEIDDAFGPRAAVEPIARRVDDAKLADHERSDARFDENEESSEAPGEGRPGVKRRGG